MNAKKRFDMRRRDCEERKLKERHRGLARREVKLGFCWDCTAEGRTVWHHETYEGKDSILVELCYRCHRKRHPRKMPNGGVV